jgi:hypothetical protein
MGLSFPDRDAPAQRLLHCACRRGLARHFISLHSWQPPPSSTRGHLQIDQCVVSCRWLGQAARSICSWNSRVCAVLAFAIACAVWCGATLTWPSYHWTVRVLGLSTCPRIYTYDLMEDVGIPAAPCHPEVQQVIHSNRTVMQACRCYIYCN